MDRWEGIERPYTEDDVERLRGSVCVEHTLARLGAERLWRLLDDEPYVAALGAMTGGQAVQMVKAGLKAIYLSGWQVAADANDAGQTYPDQSLYPANSVPTVVRRINKALQRADQIEWSEGKQGRHWFAPIVADAEAGFGGPLNAYELMKAMIEAGAAGVHFEDQVASEKKCGHLGGKVLVGDAYLGGERVGGKAGRGSENKVPLVAAVSLNTEGHPLYTKMIPVPGFTGAALTNWAKAALAPGSLVLSDGLACLSGVTAAGCHHQAIRIGLRKPDQVPEFGWLNTILGNLKTSFSGAYHAFNFAQYGTRDLAAFAYRFHRRFHLDTLPNRRLVAATAIGPRPARWLRQTEESC